MKAMSMRLLRYAPMAGLLFACAITTGCDAIRIQNAGGNSVGLLIDAESSSGFVNDSSVVTSLTEFATTNYHSSALSNEIIGFTNDRIPLGRPGRRQAFRRPAQGAAKEALQSIERRQRR